MSAALTGPYLAAAGLLCVSGVAKLRRPDPAVQALVVAGLPARRWVVRVLSGAELTLGLLALVAGGRWPAATVAGAYAGFAAFSLRLARRRAACGCFGEGQAPASGAQTGLSAALALACAVAAVWPPEGLHGLLGRSPATVCVLGVGLVGAVYAAVLAYTELPAAWSSWSAPR